MGKTKRKCVDCGETDDDLYICSSCKSIICYCCRQTHSCWEAESQNLFDNMFSEITDDD